MDIDLSQLDLSLNAGVGNVMSVSIEAVNIVEKAGFSCRVDSFCSVKPLDVNSLKCVFRDYKTVCVVEEHSSIGGAKSAILELILEICPQGIRKLVSCSLEDKFYHEVGTQNELRETAGLTGEAVAQKIISHASSACP